MYFTSTDSLWATLGVQYIDSNGSILMCITFTHSMWHVAVIFQSQYFDVQYTIT